MQGNVRTYPLQSQSTVVSSRYVSEWRNYWYDSCIRTPHCISPMEFLVSDLFGSWAGWERGLVQSVFSTLSQGLQDKFLECSLGRWADTAATYCPGRPSQIVLKSMTKHRDRVEKTLYICRLFFKFTRIWQTRLMNPTTTGCATTPTSTRPIYSATSSGTIQSPLTIKWRLPDRWTKILMKTSGSGVTPTLRWGTATAR